jgi:signal transduction histidine kinase
MVFSHFRTQSSIRVVFLGLTLAVFVYLGLDTDFYATLVLVGVLIIYQVVSLIHSVELANRQLTRFLQSIEYADLSQTFTGRKLGSSFDELYTAFTEVTNAFRTVRAEREEQYRYLQTVVQHVGVGVTVFQQNGTVELMNNTAHQLL